MVVLNVKEAARLPVRTSAHAQSTVDGRVLVTGGFDGKTVMAEAHLYNPGTNLWSAAAPMEHGLRGHVQTTLGNGLVLVCGGVSVGEREPTAKADVYDPATNRWTAVAPMNVPRFSHSASTLADGRALVCGGVLPSGRTSENPHPRPKTTDAVEVYSADDNTWTQVAPMPVRMGDHTQSTLADGRVLVCGGVLESWEDADFVPTMCIYNPTMDCWATATLPKGLIGTHNASQSTLADGRVLVTGGKVTGRSARTSALYTPKADSWGSGPDLPFNLASHSTSTLSSGDVLICAGRNPERAFLKTPYLDQVLLVHVGTVDET